ncbi:MAG: toprim domain-containing protein [Armatimonadota bacterium]
MNIQQFLEFVADRNPIQCGKEWKIVCPAHGDTTPSLFFSAGDKGGVVLYCQGGCTQESVVRALGLKMSDLCSDTSTPSSPQRKPARKPKYDGPPPWEKPIFATYDYTDESGKLIYQVVRHPPKPNGDKDFSQRRKIIEDGSAKWAWNLKGVEPTIFRLPGLLQSIEQGSAVYIVEGEKDVLSLEKFGLVATCNSGGAGKWRQRFAKHFGGAFVVILPDNDDKGRDHAKLVASTLQGVAGETRVLELPGLPIKGDVSDWIELGGTREELESLVAHATPADAWLDADNVHPIIHADCQDLRSVTAQCWEAIARANNPPRFFRYIGIPSRLEKDDDGLLIPRELTPDRMRHELARVANWVHGEKEEPAKPPVDVVRDVLATPNPELPVLTRITDVPVFAPDGTLQTEEGYHAAGQTYRMPTKDFEIPDIPSAPSAADVASSRDLILDMISEFSFVEEADRAHAVGLLILPFVRDLIDGPTPNHLIEAPQPGSGKGLLANVLLAPACGKRVSTMSEAKDDDEWRKRITSQLRGARTVILLDNVTKPLNSGSLASALTATVWEDRILGRSENLHFPVRCVWVTTANNPTMTTEIARRCIRIRLDPMVDRPWFRSGFKQPKLQRWALANRADLVGAALTLAQAWVVAGMPASEVKPLGSYEQWTAVIGGILEHAKISGFLSNLYEFYEAADIEGAVWRQIVDAWWEKFGQEKVGVNDLFGLISELDSIDLGKGGERSQKITFGKRLGRQRDRVIGDYRIVSAGKSMRISQWMLVPTAKTPSEDSKNVYVMYNDVCSHTPPHAPAHTCVHAHAHVDSENIHEHTEHTHDENPHDSSPDNSPDESLPATNFEEF